MSNAGWHVQSPGDAADGRGRRVIADRSFSVGQEVLHADPYAFAVISEQLPHLCSCGCLQPLTQPLRCSACKIACFASREHQRRGWQAGGHREECAALRAAAAFAPASLHGCPAGSAAGGSSSAAGGSTGTAASTPRVPPTAVRLALRCVLRHWASQQQQHAAPAAPTLTGAAPTSSAAAQAQGQAQGQALTGRGDHYGDLLGLQSHWEDLQDGAKLQFAQMGALAHQLLTAAAPAAAEAASPRDLAQLIARFGCNSHTISDAELQPLAVGIFPLGAMVNHDCRPNTVHTFVGSRMVFRAVRDIQPGEEVTTSYTELAATRWERRAALLQHHLFDIDAPGGAGPGAAAGPEAAARDGVGAVTEGEGEAAGGSAGGLSAPRQAQQQAQQQAAALQCLPAQQPAVVVPLPGGAGEEGAELRLYASSQPPWPHNERDMGLTEVVALPAAAAAPGSSSSRGGRRWGGMWGCLQGAAGGSSEGGSADRAVGQSFEIDDELLEAAVTEAGAGVARGGPCYEGLQGRAGAGPGQEAAAAGLGYASKAADQKPPVIHCWATADVAHQGQQQYQQQAAELAQQYAAALRLQHSLDAQLACSGGGGAAQAAVQQLQRALAALCSAGGGGGSSSNDGGRAGSRLALGPRHVLRMRLLADLHRAAISAGEWDTALAAARQLLPLYQHAYQPVWPQLGLLWASLAKLEHLQGEHPAQALAAAQAALRILGATHGGSGAAVEEMRRVAFEVQAELAQYRGRYRGQGGGSSAATAALGNVDDGDDDDDEED